MSGNFISWEEAVVWMRQQPEYGEVVESCYFDDPLLAVAERFFQNPEWQATRKFLPQKVGRVLDLGAGRGISSYALAREGWEVTALEPDSSMIVGAGAIRKLAKEAGFIIEVVERWGEELPFQKESFDVVYGRQLLHHAKDLPQLTREASRVLKKGGTFIAVREHVISRREDLKVFLESHPLHRLYGGENAFLLQEYCKAFKAAGIAPTCILNPLASDINLAPRTLESMKDIIAQKMHLPGGGLIPDLMLRLVGYFWQKPGRLYSFIGTKA
jgi:SAM-dependent methyltransferase